MPRARLPRLLGRLSWTPAPETVALLMLAAPPILSMLRTILWSIERSSLAPSLHQLLFLVFPALHLWYFWRALEGAAVSWFLRRALVIFGVSLLFSLPAYRSLLEYQHNGRSFVGWLVLSGLLWTLAEALLLKWVLALRGRASSDAGTRLLGLVARWLAIRGVLGAVGELFSLGEGSPALSDYFYGLLGALAAAAALSGLLGWRRFVQGLYRGEERGLRVASCREVEAPASLPITFGALSNDGVLLRREELVDAPYRAGETGVPIAFVPRSGGELLGWLARQIQQSAALLALHLLLLVGPTILPAILFAGAPPVG